MYSFLVSYFGTVFSSKALNYSSEAAQIIHTVIYKGKIVVNYWKRLLFIQI